MTVNGTEITIFDDFEVEFGESCVYTENHLLRHHKRVKKEANANTGVTLLIIKNVPLAGAPGKCILEYDKAGRLSAVSFKLKASDYRDLHDPEDACDGARELASIIVEDLAEVFGRIGAVGCTAGNFEGSDDLFRISVGAVYNPTPGVNVRISKI